MANALHASELRKGVVAWNQWRLQNPDVQPDLSGTDLRGIRLCGGDRDADHYGSLLAGESQRLSEVFRDGANLKAVSFRGANLVDANLCYCDLTGADLSETIMSRALLCSSRLVGANLFWASLDKVDANNAEFDRCNLDRVNFGGADLAAARFTSCSLVDASLFESNLTNTKFHDTELTRCDLMYSRLVRTEFIRSCLCDCKIHGVSVWDVHAEDATISELSITPDGQPSITVDDLDVAQFLYLVLENKRLRTAIDSMTGKIVLILGRFTPERKRVLDTLRTALRARGFVSVLFDFDKPSGRDLTETVSLLAHMACFILADISDPRSIPQELQRIVPALPSVPVQPLIAAGQAAYGMFVDFGGYPSVLPPFRYSCDQDLIERLDTSVLGAIQERLTAIHERRKRFEEAIASINQTGGDAG